MSVSRLPLPGPLLYAREFSASAARVDVLVTTPEDASAPPIDVPGGEATEPERLYARFGAAVWRAGLTLPAHPDSHYAVDGRSYPVLTELTGDCRFAFVSCNGREKGDEGWDEAERNVMWSRLAAEHRASPLALLLQGGDQIYADNVQFCHPQVARWAKAKPSRKPTFELTQEMATTAERYLFHRYLTLLAMSDIGGLMAEVPSFMIWDDHDIFDGWGSHPPPVQQSEIGRMLFETGRRMFRLFQLGLEPDGRNGAGGFTRTLRLPRVAVTTPDLRSTRNRHRVMDEPSWEAFEAELGRLPKGEPLFVISSVPALGPRLSLVEMAMRVAPRIQRYEDDLRDQWQSRAHREEWRRFLRLLEREIVERERIVTVLSGEIHLATRGEMRLPSGEKLQQLVSSGISHPPPPPAYPRLLGLLARLGEAPLRDRPISLHPLPGRRPIYTRERNYLLLIREEGRWCAIWETEEQGPTEALSLSGR